MQRRASLLAPLAVASDMRARAEGYVRASQMNQLGDSEAGLDRQHEKQAIPSADPRRHVRGRHHGVDLWATQEGDRSPLVALGRNRENTATAVDMGRLADRHIPKERVNGSEPDIARAGAVPAGLLDMVQKLADKRCVEIFKGQARRIFAEPLVRKPQQEAKRIAVRRDGVGTGLTLSDESVGRAVSTILRQPGAKVYCSDSTVRMSAVD